MFDTIRRDTAAFGPRQWHVVDLSGPMFSTREDAEDALRLADQLQVRAVEDLAQRIRDVLP